MPVGYHVVLDMAASQLLGTLVCPHGAVKQQTTGITGGAVINKKSGGGNWEFRILLLTGRAVTASHGLGEEKIFLLLESKVRAEAASLLICKVWSPPAGSAIEERWGVRAPPAVLLMACQ